MYGEASYAEISYGDSIELVAPIIPEVGIEARQIIIALEIDAIKIAVSSDPVVPVPIHQIAASFDVAARGRRTLQTTLDAVGGVAATTRTVAATFDAATLGRRTMQATFDAVTPGSGVTVELVSWFAGYDANNMPETEIPWSLGITHLNHFSAWPTVTGSVSSINMAQFAPALNPAAVLASRSAASSTAKFCLCVGGAASDTAFKNAIDTDRPGFIADIVSKMNTNGYEGVDIDWEHSDYSAGNVTRFDGFMRALKTAMNVAHPTWLLTTSSAGRPFPSYTANWMPMLKDLYDDGVLDHIYVQLIQIAGPSYSDGNVWFGSAIHSASDFGTPFPVGVEEALAAYIAGGYSGDELICGFQMSGRPWTDGIMDVDPGSGGCFEPCQKWTAATVLNRPAFGGEILYRDIIKLIPEPLSITMDTNRQICGGLITFSNAAANASQLNAMGADSSGTSNSPSAAAVSSTVNNCLAVTMFACTGAQDLATVQTNVPAGWTLLTALRSSLTTAAFDGSKVTLGIATKQLPTAGAAGVATWTSALGASREWLAKTYIIAPAASTIPSVHSMASMGSKTAPDNPQEFYLNQQLYTAGDYVLGIAAAVGTSATITGMGTSDDTYTEIDEQNSTNLALGVYEGTITGGIGGPNVHLRDIAAGGCGFISNPVSTMFLAYDDEISLADYKVPFLFTGGALADGRKVRGMGLWTCSWDYNSAGGTVAEKHPVINAVATALGALTGGGGGGYSPNPVNFDGTNDYLARGAALSSVADGKLATGSVWIRRTSLSGTQRIFWTLSSRFGLDIVATTNLWRLFGQTSASAITLNITGTAIADTNWHHLMFSIDLTSTSLRHMYKDGAADTITSNTYSNNNMNFSNTNFTIGATPTTEKWSGDMADLMIWHNQYLDLSVAGNRALFINAGAPVDPAAAITALGTPTVRLSGATATWETNLGSGGGFTETGALTDGTGPVEL